MQPLRPANLAALAAALLLLAAATTHAHNITRILEKHPDFSTFNKYLTLTHLAPEINRRITITVCAIDNTAMNELLSKHPSIYTLKNILSLHVLLDYFGAKKLHQITNGTALAATMFQATGTAPGSTGFVNITDLRGLLKAFLPKYKNLTAAGKASLLEYHATPVYESMAMLKSNNGLMNTLATDGASKFDFTVQNDGDQVTLKTKIVTAKITGTLIDEDPLAIYTIDKVLLPRELFKALAPSPSPSPAPEPAAADAPASPKKGGKKKKQKAADAPADEESAPADSPSDAADESADDGNGAVRFDGVRYGNVIFVVMALCFGFSLL
ncbi:fasciclin-like arabinogalactan protein 1 [Arachis ipaensis]|uniref:fasciclin-like arabinogalactan protein 1 n=1 Tax=Arachis ipaensis TaxID=130454 RepID=UPI0007AF7C38|nr:fasciclin-like arabinogalactan protein 1 [Arachis ipaensis]